MRLLSPFRQRRVVVALFALVLTITYFRLTLIESVCEPNGASPQFGKPLAAGTWNTLTGAQIVEFFKWTNRDSCDLVQYFGGFLRGYPSAKDGIKAVCLDPKIAPNPNGCLVYSFGINIDWTFDEDMEKFGCELFCFDPSINKTHHDHAPYIHFFNWGLGNFNGKGSGSKSTWQIHTLSYIYDKLSRFHDKNTTIDYLKMDIEGDEWSVIPDLIQSGMLDKVRQLTVEIHLEPSDTIEKFYEKVRILQSLETAGMVRFDSMYNPWLVKKFHHLNLTTYAGWDISFYNSKFVVPHRLVVN